MKERPLISMNVDAFARELASNSPAPGGGSVAALAGALSAGLSSMVAALTFDKKGFEAKKPLMEELGVKAQGLLRNQLEAVDDDTWAFNKVMDCFSMPKETDEQKAARKTAIQAANKEAALEPLRTLERSVPLLDLAHKTALDGNPNSLSDAGVAGLMARAAAYGAYYNVLINLSGIEDKTWCEDIRKKATGFITEVDKKAAEIEKHLLEKLKN